MELKIVPVMDEKGEKVVDLIGKIGDKTFDLDHLRKYLIDNHPTLVKKNFIKTIPIKGQWVRTYDWDYIFYVVKNNEDIIKDFSNDYLV